MEGDWLGMERRCMLLCGVVERLRGGRGDDGSYTVCGVENCLKKAEGKGDVAGE